MELVEKVQKLVFVMVTAYGEGAMYIEQAAVVSAQFRGSNPLLSISFGPDYKLYVDAIVWGRYYDEVAGTYHARNNISVDDVSMKPWLPGPQPASECWQCPYIPPEANIHLHTALAWLVSKLQTYFSRVRAAVRIQRSWRHLLRTRQMQILAAGIIQEQWRRSIADPCYQCCSRRLLWEFGEMTRAPRALSWSSALRITSPLRNQITTHSRLFE
jgi:hypothetical protein